MLDRRLELLRELANRRWVGGATIFLQAQPGAKASSQRARTEKHRLTVNLLATNPFEDGKCKCGWTGPRSEWEATRGEPNDLRRQLRVP